MESVVYFSGPDSASLDYTRPWTLSEHDAGGISELGCHWWRFATLSLLIHHTDASTHEHAHSTAGDGNRLYYWLGNGKHLLLPVLWPTLLIWWILYWFLINLLCGKQEACTDLAHTVTPDWPLAIQYNYKPVGCGCSFITHFISYIRPIQRSSPRFPFRILFILWLGGLL